MTVFLWIGFVVFVAFLLALDLGVLHRKAHVPSTREALAWTALWVTVALAFGGFVWIAYEHNWLDVAVSLGEPVPGRQAALEFLTGYLIEYSLSLDNIFVIAMVFAYFRVPAEFQHRVLFWGIIGAQAMRGIMILLGLAFIETFAWAVYVLGALLIATAARMLVVEEDELEPEKNLFVRVVRKFYPVTSQYHGTRFFIRRDGKLTATPLALALVVVESMDLLFAVDSIPAVMAVTWDPFIVFTSNVFAILGLRSLYFALAALMARFRYLKISIVFILGFVGVKMLLSHHYKIPTLQSLHVIASFLVVGILASLYATRRTPRGPGGRKRTPAWETEYPPAPSDPPGAKKQDTKDKPSPEPPNDPPGAKQ
jgi:tellurite resistance protein TerC